MRAEATMSAEPLTAVALSPRHDAKIVDSVLHDVLVIAVSARARPHGPQYLQVVHPTTSYLLQYLLSSCCNCVRSPIGNPGRVSDS